MKLMLFFVGLVPLAVKCQDTLEIKHIKQSKSDSVMIAPNNINFKQVVPRYKTPKGNIFCRMEDVVTKKTGVWLKVGVTDKPFR